MKYSLKRSRSLKHRQQIKTLFEKGTWMKSRHISLVYFPATEKKFIFTASRSSGSAVQRNLRKRHMREVVRKRLSDIPEGYFAFIVKYLPETEIGSRLDAELSNLLKSVPAAQTDGLSTPSLSLVKDSQ